MPDNNEELSKKVEKLEKEIEDLRKKLEENSEKDKKHHQELKDLQKQNQEANQKNHEKHMTWQRIQGGGILAVPVIIPLLNWFLSRKNQITSQEVKPIKKDADDLNSKMSKVIELLEKQQKNGNK
jgi:DNA repair exonuclease SbcCD ATPase subunit